MTREQKLETIVKLLAKVMFYNDWKCETPNERVIEMLMKEIDLYPFQNEDAMIVNTKVDDELYKRAYNDNTIKFPLLTRLRKHLDSITPEEFDKSIDEFIEKYPSGPTMEEFLSAPRYECNMEDCPHCAYERQQKYEEELEKDACIDFAKWLAQSDWMSIWVGDKWIWDLEFKDDSTLGWKTEEELYQIYLNEN